MEMTSADCKASDVITRACLLVASMKESCAWLLAVPNSSLGLTMRSSEKQLVLPRVALCTSQFDIWLDNFSFSETVLGYGAVISKNLFLVRIYWISHSLWWGKSCLLSNSVFFLYCFCQVKYGLLLATFKTINWCCCLYYSELSPVSVYWWPASTQSIWLSHIGAEQDGLLYLKY